MTDKERLEEIKRTWCDRYMLLDVKWLIEKVEEYERYKKYVMYFAGKDKVNGIRLSMQDKELG